MEIGHNGVIHTLDRGPNLVAKGQIGGTIFSKISDRADLPLFSQIGAENVKILHRFQIRIRSVPDRGLQIGVSRSVLTVFTTRCLKEQQSSDNLIVKEYYFIIEIFDKFSFSGILRGCLSHLNEA